MSITILPKLPPKLKFTQLQDAPQTYIGNRNKAVFVKNTEDGLEFKELEIPSGGGGFDAPIDIVFQTLNIVQIEYSPNNIDIVRMVADTGNVVEYDYTLSHQIAQARYYAEDGSTLLLTITYSYDANSKLISIARE